MSSRRLAELQTLADFLAGHTSSTPARADLLERLGRIPEARVATTRALSSPPTTPSAAFLTRLRRHPLTDGS